MLINLQQKNFFLVRTKQSQYIFLKHCLYPWRFLRMWCAVWKKKGHYMYYYPTLVMKVGLCFIYHNEQIKCLPIDFAPRVMNLIVWMLLRCSPSVSARRAWPTSSASRTSMAAMSPMVVLMSVDMSSWVPDWYFHVLAARAHSWTKPSSRSAARTWWRCFPKQSWV